MNKDSKAKPRPSRRRRNPLGPVRNQGNALDLSDADDKLKIRFWSYVDTGQGLEACWPWTGGCGSSGIRRASGDLFEPYGRFTITAPLPPRHRSRRRTVGAHRVAYALTHGPIADREVICHRCDNPPCCNPAHLFKGTRRDNMIDSLSKGRANKNRFSRPITEDEIRLIRSDTSRKTKEWAEQLDLPYGVVYGVLKNKTWKHVK